MRTCLSIAGAGLMIRRGSWRSAVALAAVVACRLAWMCAIRLGGAAVLEAAAALGGRGCAWGADASCHTSHAGAGLPCGVCTGRAGLWWSTMARFQVTRHAAAFNVIAMLTDSRISEDRRGA